MSDFSKVERSPRGVHQAPRHPYQQVYGLSIFKALPSYEGAPRLEVEGEGYGSAQRLMLLTARLERIGNSVLHRLPVAEEEHIVLLRDGIQRRVTQYAGQHRLCTPVVGVDLR